MKIKCLIFSILIFAFPLCALTKPPELTPHSTRKKAEEIFEAHFKCKKFTPELARRTLQNYLEELDPAKIYLIEKEVIDWIDPSEALLKQIVLNFKKENFSLFDQIYDSMVSAIDRRSQIELKIADQELVKVDLSDFNEGVWAKSEQELEERLLKLRSFQLEAAEKLNFETKEQLVKRLHKRRISREQEILQKDQKDRQKQQMAFFLKALASALDSHTVYFTPSEANQFMIQIQQRLFGIGAKLRDDLNGFTIVHFVEGGPSDRDGRLKVGDRIIAVDHEPVVGMDIAEAVELVRGPQETAVTLTILREGFGEEEQKKTEKLEFKIIRGEIVLKESRFESTTLPYGDGVIGHVRLFSFYQDPNQSSAFDVKKAIEEMKEQNRLKGVILDLRGNAGGLLPQAVAVAGLFIKKGVVVSTKDSGGNMQHLRNFDPTPVWDGPLVVLTNKGSASSSEIVAQTLQDYGCALLVGDPSTWGKGSYQTFTVEGVDGFSINPQGEYKVTRGLYYTVSGKSPQLRGALVDIPVPGGLTEVKIGESETKFPLESDTIKPNFQDKLLDIHPFHRLKMKRHYQLGLQSRLTTYKPYIETLKKNSERRIQKNKNYQNFLTEIKKEKEDESRAEGYGQNDLQLEETVCIMKDLLLLIGLKATEQIKTPSAA